MVSEIILHKIMKKMYYCYKEIYGESLRTVYLYGSYARGDYREDSDIDIAAIAQGERLELQQKLEHVFSVSNELGLAYDVWISPTVIPEDEFIQYREALPYYRNICTEGIAYDLDKNSLRSKVKMPIGISDFKVAKEEYYVVDKTAFIQKLIDDYKKVMVFTRPRQFGKTFMLSMVAYFFSMDKKEEAQHLFKGTAIRRAGTFYAQQQGAYPVIFLALKGIQADTWEEWYCAFVLLMRQVYETYRTVWQNAKMHPARKEYYERIAAGVADPAEYRLSLERLTDLLAQQLHTKPIILLDDYDVPLQDAYTHGFHEKVVTFYYGWLRAALKDNASLHFAILAGVWPIGADGITMGLNNFITYSIFDDAYSDVFGFSEEDVRHMAADLGKEERFSELQRWYDGYTFGKTKIYNPWSIMQYFSHTCTPALYWIQVANTDIFKQLLAKATPSEMEMLQDIVRDGTVAASIGNTIGYGSLAVEQNDIFTSLVTMGYLTVDTVIDHADRQYILRIPNKEIGYIYRKHDIL